MDKDWDRKNIVILSDKPKQIGKKMWRLGGLLVMLLLSSWYHPIHVSVTNIELDPDAGKIELSVKIFSDDFQDMILRQYGVMLNLVEQEDPGERINVINGYIADALKVEINGKVTIDAGFTRSELNEEAIWLYYEYEYDKRIRRMKVDNRIMLDHFDDQTNLVIVSYHNGD